jgi:two-component system phosphate regulon sensor histidine kinase PhoR
LIEKFTFFKSLFTALALSFCAASVVWALWATGLLAPVQSLFVLSPSKGAAQTVALQAWVATVLILMASICSGMAIERMGAHRALPFIGGALATLCILSLAASRFLQFDIVFAPLAMAALVSALLIQVWRLWKIDAVLTGQMRRVASQFNQLEGRDAHARLMSGLKLLETVLPLDEAVIFQRDKDNHLAPAARLRSSKVAEALEAARNNSWREGVQLCERVVKTGEIIATTTQAGVESESHTASVAVPLRHEGRAVGALLVRLREDFDESDRPLLAAVGAQLARNFQRDEARKHARKKESWPLVSISAARQRFEEFNVVSGLLTEQRFGAQVLSSAADGYAIAYLDGTLAYVNPPLLQMAQLPLAAVRQFDLFGLLERFRTGVFDEPSIAVRRVLQTGEAYERELFYAERNQTLSIRIALAVEQNGETASEPLCLAVNICDVTRIKEYDKLKSDMISLMSHELRTPITSINGFAELLSMDEAIPQESREFLTIITNESQRLSRMIDTFLAVTQLEQADKQEVRMIPLKLDDVVRETMATMQPVAKKKRIRLVEQPAQKMPPVAADKGLITQVVTNLVGNAIKYSPERTTVTVSTELEADAVRVSVEDRGYGIPPESVDRVWEKFYRVARDGQEKDEESTGLGLSFVREVVEQHGGEVTLESEVGRGSKFTFTLPRL